jgi:ribonuclease VapC
VIAVDTSALMAVVLGERQSDAIITALASDTEVLISAATMAEALVVATGRNVGDDMGQLLGEMMNEVVPVSAATARRVAEAYAKWGKGNHRAGLNLCDCFGYALAIERSCPLLFVGADFARTDVQRLF